RTDAAMDLECELLGVVDGPAAVDFAELAISVHHSEGNDVLLSSDRGIELANDSGRIARLDRLGEARALRDGSRFRAHDGFRRARELLRKIERLIEPRSNLRHVEARRGVAHGLF